MTTPNLGLIQDTPGVTPGMTEAEDAEENKETLDDHNHSPGKGERVPTLGILVNDDLTFNSYAATELRMARFDNLLAEPTAGDDIRAVYVYDNNLYFIRHDGTKVKITNGGVLNASALNSDTYVQQSVTTNLSVGNAAAYTQLIVDSSVGALTIDFAPCAGFSAGRYFIITDIGNGANAITITPDVADTINGIAGSRTFKLKYGEVKLTRVASTKWTLAGSITHVINGTEATGAVLQITTAGAANWGAVDLSGATTAITGVLPPGNMTDAAAGTKGIVQLTQDLGGTAGAPTVTLLSGLAGTLYVRPTCTNLVFSDPAAGAGNDIAIGGSNAVSGKGGDINVIPGRSNAAGTEAGGAYLSVKQSGGSSTPMVSAKGFTDTRRVLGLVGSPSTTDVPAGDKVVYFGNAVTEPADSIASDIPVNGFVMFAGGSGGGKVGFKLNSGEKYILGGWVLAGSLGALAGYINFKIGATNYKLPIYN
jgi:hypothetical protein